MAILKAAATASDTLDATSDALIVGLTLTPASGDYFLYATVQFVTAGTAGSEDNFFSVYVGGSQIAHSERIFKEDTSVDACQLVVALACKVSPNGSQAVEIRHRASSASSPLVAQNREMTLFPISGTDYEQTDETTRTLATATWTLVNNMSVTPIAGTYLAMFTTSGRGPSTAELAFRIRVGGVVVASSLRETEQESSGANADVSISTVAKISPNGSEVVDVQWSRITGTGTITIDKKALNLIPTPSGDIFAAEGTADDTDSTTTDKQIDDMLISSPGAADYLAIFNCTDHYGTIANNVAETVYSLRVAGTKVTDSDRVNEHEGSLDDVNLISACGGRITVGAAENVQVYWQNANTDLRTCRERTLVIIREPSVATREQEGFRWRNDDGSESAATWRENQDVNEPSIGTAANIRLRMLLNMTNDPPSEQYQLEYKETSDPDAEYRVVPLT